MMRRGWGARGRARGRALAGALALTGALGACNLIQPLDPSLEAGFLTTDRNDDYGITVAGGAVTASAPATNESGNTRIAFWPAGASQTSAHQSCLSWVEGDHGVQQGIALRVRSTAGRTTAITVTKNVYAGFYRVFNVHVMDSGAEQPFTLISQFRFDRALLRDGVPAPAPWRLCARVVGDAVSVKVWAADEAEPAWMDGIHSGGVVLPAGWDAPGVAGWYVGHLPPGASMTYTALETLDMTVPAEPTDPAAAASPLTAADAAEGGSTVATVPYQAPTDISRAP
jgi:hypothetical protein